MEEEKAILEASLAKEREAREREARRVKDRQMAGFLRTEAGPELRYLPAVLTEEQASVIQRQLEEVDGLEKNTEN